MLFTLAKRAASTVIVATRYRGATQTALRLAICRDLPFYDGVHSSLLTIVVRAKYIPIVGLTLDII